MNPAPAFFLGLVIGAAGMLMIAPTHEAPVNHELATTTQHAVRAAERAHRANDAAHLAAGRFDLLAITLAVSAPLTLVGVLAWIAHRHRPAPAELAHRLVTLQSRPRRQVESSSPTTLNAKHTASLPPAVEPRPDGRQSC